LLPFTYSTNDLAPLRHLPEAFLFVTTRHAVPSPGEFDLELSFVVAEFDLDLEVDLLRYVDGDAPPVAYELDLVVPGEGIGQRVQTLRRLLSAQPFTFVDLEQIHPDLLATRV
jgi:hypothetical protein